MIEKQVATGWAGVWGNKKQEIEMTLLLSCCFSILLLSVRMIVTGSMMYGFLAWNLFLAYTPYSITSWLVKDERLIRSRLKFAALFLIWLVLIPNSFYILTDLFHLDEGIAAPQWFNLVLIFSFAWNGWLLGTLSLRKMEKMMEQFIPVGKRQFFLYGIMGLNAFGIYIGRYLRFNSWDIIMSPFQLAKDIIYLCIHPLRNIQEWAMIFCYAVLLILVYHSIKKINEVI